MNDDRRSPFENGFQDPLQNSEPTKPEDPLQRALIERDVSAIESEPFVMISPETPIKTAVRKMVELQVECLLVANENGRLLGVFSDRDLLNRVALEYEALKDRPVREVMVTRPVSVHLTDSAAVTLCVMAASGYRHVPVLNRDDQVVGIVSPQRVNSFLREHAQP